LLQERETMRRLLQLTAFLACFLGGSTVQAWHHHRGVPVTTTAISTVPVTGASFVQTSGFATMSTASLATVPVAGVSALPTVATFPTTAAFPTVASFGCTGGSAATASYLLTPTTSSTTASAINPVDIARLVDLFLSRRPTDGGGGTADGQLLAKVSAIADDVRSIKADTSATTERLRRFLDTPSDGKKPSPGKNGIPTKPLSGHFSELQAALQSGGAAAAASAELHKKHQEDLSALKEAQNQLNEQLKIQKIQLEKHEQKLDEILDRLKKLPKPAAK
jgi:hypothetical protein